MVSGSFCSQSSRIGVLRSIVLLQLCFESAFPLVNEVDYNHRHWNPQFFVSPNIKKISQVNYDQVREGAPGHQLFDIVRSINRSFLLESIEEAPVKEVNTWLTQGLKSTIAAITELEDILICLLVEETGPKSIGGGTHNFYGLNPFHWTQRKID